MERGAPSERRTDAASYREAPRPAYPDHQGQPIPGAIYAVRPDPIIGDVLTAWTNQDQHGMRVVGRKNRRLAILGVLLIAALLAFLVGMLVLFVLDALGLHPHPALVYGPLGVVSAIALLLLSRPRPCCSYIGKDGVHEHLEYPLRTRDASMRFADVDALFVRQTERYGGGNAYQGTEYAVVFRDRAAKSLFEITGLRHDHGMWAEVSEHWVFAQAVIARWSALRWDRAKAERERTGLATFRVGDKVLGVGERRLVLGALGPDGAIEGETLTPDDLERVEIHDGTLQITRRGAKEGLFRSTGIDRFLVAEVGDLDVLLRALRTWAGIPVREREG